LCIKLDTHLPRTLISGQRIMLCSGVFNIIILRQIKQWGNNLNCNVTG
jgi:hypothetical protein